MKKKIVIGILSLTVVFLLSGLYIMFKIERISSQLHSLVVSHQVEVLRRNLSGKLKRVQLDFFLLNTKYAQKINTMLNDMRDMQLYADKCLTCHHSPDVVGKLIFIRSNINEYKNGLNRVLAEKTDSSRLRAEKTRIYMEGQHLVAVVDKVADLASVRLAERTRITLGEVDRTKGLLFILLALGPFAAGILTYITIGGITKPVRVLVDAARKLKKSNLDYRVEGLDHEFGEVADALNEMSGSLRENIHKLEKNEKRYRTLFESAGDAIFILEAEGENPGRIISANIAAAEMHGYTMEELLALTIMDLDTPESAVGAGERIEKMLRGEWVKMEAGHRRKDGSVFFVDVSAGLLDLGDHKYILAFDRDITERKQVDERLQRAEQLKICGELATGLAHEIKNPLAGIKACMEVLAEEIPLPEEDKGVLLEVVDEIRRIELLLKTLLNFAKPSMPQMVDVDIHDVLDTAMTFSLKDRSSPSGGPGKIRIVRDFAPYLPEVLADPMHLQQVFLNLLLNAADAMPEGGTLGIKTAYNQSLKVVQIDIADTGKGIGEGNMYKVFHPFFTTKAKGTGLGLAITKQLVEQHGGDISARNNENCGATFTITLPTGLP